VNVYDFAVRTADGDSKDLRDYAGQLLLIVNVASKCGLTPQYDGLEALYRDAKGDGLEILGFPCNQFGGQEPGTDAEIQDFCAASYSVTFPVFGKIEVNGPGADRCMRTCAPRRLATSALATASCTSTSATSGRKRSGPTRSSGTSPSSSSIATALSSAATSPPSLPARSARTWTRCSPPEPAA